MPIELLDPDEQYAAILKKDDKCEKALAFLRKEAKNFVRLKHLLERCHDDHGYELLIPKMIECTHHIRKENLKSLENQLGLFDFKMKRYFRRLMKELKL